MNRVIAKHFPLMFFAVLCAGMAMVTEAFHDPQNLQNVSYRTAVIAIIALGQLLVILTGGIDLSVGSVAALSGVMGCVAMKWMANTAELSGTLACLLGIGVGTLIGLVCGTLNGALITKGKIPPFIVTLGMMMAARGLTLVISGGAPIFGMPASFAWLGGAKAWWTPVLIMLVFTAIAVIMLNYSRFGRALYAIGGNKNAARLSGLPVDRDMTLAYMVCGTLAGFAGMMLASQTSIAAPTAAEMYELDAIAACVIGGASLMGGEGGAVGALAGALIMQVLKNYCTLENVQVYWQQILVGCLVVALVFYDNYRKRRAGLLSE
jgi:ribose transport system permease protein